MSLVQYRRRKSRADRCTPRLPNLKYGRKTKRNKEGPESDARTLSLFSLLVFFSLVRKRRAQPAANLRALICRLPEPTGGGGGPGDAAADPRPPQPSPQPPCRGTHTTTVHTGN